jgi:hypothetical protein
VPAAGFYPTIQRKTKAIHTGTMRLGCQSLPICLDVVAPDDELDAFIR